MVGVEEVEVAEGVTAYTSESLSREECREIGVPAVESLIPRPIDLINSYYNQ